MTLAAALTDVGQRKAGNQDAYSLKIIACGADELAFAVMCDGVGGMAEGELASSAVVRAFQDWFDGQQSALLTRAISPQALFDQWKQVLDAVNLRIYRYGQQKKIRLGTTAAVVLLMGGRLFSAYVGDTRLYAVSDQLLQLSHDHTLVQREVEAGRLTPQGALEDRRKNILLRCIGAEPTVLAEYRALPVADKAMYLLCTDGFYHTLTERELCDTLAYDRGGDADALAQTLEGLFARIRHRGERDNMSALLLRPDEIADLSEQTVELEPKITLRCGDAFFYTKALIEAAE